MTRLHFLKILSISNYGAKRREGHLAAWAVCVCYYQILCYNKQTTAGFTRERVTCATATTPSPASDQPSTIQIKPKKMSELLDGYHPATIAGKLPPADEEDVWCYVNINGYWCRFYDLKDRAFCLHRTISDYCYYYNLPSSFRLVDKYNQFPISEYTKEELMTFGSLDGIPGPTKNFGELLYEHDTINGKHLHLQFETKGLHTLVVATRLFSLLQTKPLGMFETSQVAGERSAVVSKHYLLKI